MHRTQRNTLLASLALAGTWPLAAQTAAPAPETKPSAGTDEVVVLSPFEVTASESSGYVATTTLAGSRLNTRLEDVGSAISVVTSEFLKDTAATDNKSLLAYTTGTEVSGTQGNFAAMSGQQTEAEVTRLVNPNANTRVRGLSAADNTRNFFISDIPWDGYNVDRVDMQRGANSILFGLGSPSGLINTTTKTAQHRNFGSVEMRYGSYGASRQVLDYNHCILPDELSLRVNLLRNDEKYKQDPAYSLDRRVFTTLRYDPKFLNRGDMRTSIKANYESGSVRSNNPRQLTPVDAITPWWDVLNQASYSPSLVQYRGKMWNEANPSGYYANTTGAFEKTYDNGSNNPNYQPYLGQPLFFGGIWMPVNAGETTPYAVQMPEYRNIGGRSSAGTVDGSINGLLYSRRVSVATTSYYAERNSSLPFASWGVWKSATLSDPSVFDFYNNLIDGDNKREWQNFHNIDLALNQTFFKDKVGYELAYDQQRYRRGQYAFSGNGALYVDINSHNLDGTVNPNFGKAYIESNYTNANNAFDSTREAARFSAYATHDFNKGGDRGWFRKLLGKHTLSTLYSQESVRTDSRSFMRYGTPDSFAALSNTNLTASNEATKINGNDRTVATTIYLSESLAGLSSYRDGLGISRAGSAVEIPSTATVRYFNSTWTATGVNPADPWTSTATGEALTQSENPANYAGWSTTSVDILSAENGDQDLLTTSAILDKRKTDSRAVVMQSYFWDGAIVGMYGIRKDHVKAQAYNGTNLNSRNRIDFTAVDADGRLQYSTVGKRYDIYTANSPSWSVVAKLNKFAGRFGERLPVNVSLFYNESQNFQVVGAGYDILGNPLPAPTGKTNERGIMLSTKDDRFSLKINKYETSVKNSRNSSLNDNIWFFTGSGNFICRNEDRADAYEYHLTSLGDPNSVAETGTTTGTWVWRYAPRGTETQAQADANAAAAVSAWRAYTNEPLVKQILAAWGFNDFNVTQSTRMSTPVPNFLATEDQYSKGWEFEFTANPTKNWRISINATKTEAMRENVGGADDSVFNQFLALTNTYQNNGFGDLRQWGGGQNGLPPPSLNSWNLNFYSKYLLMKLQEGTYSSELRPWRVNLVTNYSFTEGRLKGFNVGAGYRWMDRATIGYPCLTDSSGPGLPKVTFDVDHPWKAPREDYIDFWVGYERKLTDKIDWRIQLNVRNLGEGNGLTPVSRQQNGQVAAWSISPSQSWTLTNTFSF